MLQFSTRRKAPNADAAPVKQLAIELSGEHMPCSRHERHEDFAESALNRPLGAVIDLEGNSESKLWQSRAMHAFRATLHEDLGSERCHHDGVQTAVSRDQHGRSEAGRNQSLCRLRPLWRKSLTVSKPGKAERQGVERERPGRHRTAVDSHAHAVERYAASL